MNEKDDGYALSALKENRAALASEGLTYLRRKGSVGPLDMVKGVRVWRLCELAPHN